MQAEPVDVVVAGRGPAAFAAGLTVRRQGLRVTVVGIRDSVPRWGETLPGSCLPLLARLGIADAVRKGAHMRGQGHVSVWGGRQAQERDAIANPFGAGVILDRNRFINDLETIFVAEGGVVIDARPDEIKRSGVGFTVSLRRLAELPGLSARAVMDATGRAGWLGRRLGTRRAPGGGRQIALGLCYQAPPFEELPAVTYLEAIEDGWLYAAPVAPNRAVIWWVTDADLVVPPGDDGPAKVAARARGSTEIARWLREWRLESTHQWGARDASAGGIDRAAGEGWVAAGDAALRLDPLSSSGITLALLSGMHGGMAIGGWLAGEAGTLESYANMIARARASHLARRGGFYRIETRWPRAVFWRRRAPIAGASLADRV